MGLRLQRNDKPHREEVHNAESQEVVERNGGEAVP